MARSRVHALCHDGRADSQTEPGYGPCVTAAMLILEMVVWLTLGALEGLLLCCVTAVTYARRPLSLHLWSAGAGLVGGLVHRMAGARPLHELDPESMLVAGITAMIAALTWHVLTTHVPARPDGRRRPAP